MLSTVSKQQQKLLAQRPLPYNDRGHRIDATLSGSKANIAIKLFGDDLNRLFLLGNEIKAASMDIEGIADLNVEQQIERPQLTISPRREMLARYGITIPQFAEFVRVALAGEAVSQVYVIQNTTKPDDLLRHPA